jgi:sugar/nucleoside kinase (ribokinase family)
LLTSNEVSYVPAFNIQQVDATGAGDAFGCGLVWALLRGHTIAEALRYGNAAGAIVAAHRGIFDILPNAAELDTWITQAEQLN